MIDNIIFITCFLSLLLNIYFYKRIKDVLEKLAFEKRKALIKKAEGR